MRSDQRLHTDRFHFQGTFLSTLVQMTLIGGLFLLDSGLESQKVKISQIRVGPDLDPATTVVWNEEG